MEVNLFIVFIIIVLCLHLKLYNKNFFFFSFLSEVGDFTIGGGLYVQFIDSKVVCYKGSLKSSTI